MAETQLWTLHDKVESYVLELEWTGEALTDLTIGEYADGGLFRMPWRAGMEAAVASNARQRDARANGQRAAPGRRRPQTRWPRRPGHIAILDHPENDGYPTPWRVDDQFGIGPSRAILGDLEISTRANRPPSATSSSSTPAISTT